MFIRQLDFGGKVAEYRYMPKYPSLKQQEIPFTFEYTNKLVKLLTRIAKTKPYIEDYWGTPLEVELLRQAKIRAITFSNQIEGNKLEERGVTKALDEQDSQSDEKDIIEVRNYSDALEYIETLAKDKKRVTTRDLCDIQKLITRDVLKDKKQWGNIRSIPVDIVDANTGKKIDKCPEPHFLKELLDELWLWIEDNQETDPFVRAFAFHYLAVAIHPFADGNGRTTRLMQHLLLLKELLDELWLWIEDNQETDPFVRAFAFHYLAVAIHPFADGNGRTTRLMQHLLLLKADEKIARYVPSETAIMATRDQYYSSIRQCKALGSLNPIIEYLAECFAVAAENVIEESKKLIKKSLDRKPEARQQKILSLSKQNKEFSIQNVLTALPEVPRRTLERDLEKLVKEKKLRAKGDKRSRIYLKS